MAARDSQSAAGHLNTHHQQQSQAISGESRGRSQIDDLTAAAQTKVTAALVTELGNIANCAECDAIVSDGVTLAATPEPALASE